MTLVNLSRWLTQRREAICAPMKNENIMNSEISSQKYADGAVRFVFDLVLASEKCYFSIKKHHLTSFLLLKNHYSRDPVQPEKFLIALEATNPKIRKKSENFAESWERDANESERFVPL